MLFPPYGDYEKIATAAELTAKQRAQLLRIGHNTRASRLLGPNGRRLAEEVWKQFCQDTDGEDSRAG